METYREPTEGAAFEWVQRTPGFMTWPGIVMAVPLVVGTLVFGFRETKLVCQRADNGTVTLGFAMIAFALLLMRWKIAITIDGAPPILTVLEARWPIHVRKQTFGVSPETTFAFEPAPPPQVVGALVMKRPGKATEHLLKMLPRDPQLPCLLEGLERRARGPMS